MAQVSFQCLFASAIAWNVPSAASAMWLAQALIRTGLTLSALLPGRMRNTRFVATAKEGRISLDGNGAEPKPVKFQKQLMIAATARSKKSGPCQPNDWSDRKNLPLIATDEH